MHPAIDALSCVSTKCHGKGEQCLRDQCVKEVNKLIRFMDKQVATNIEVHEKNLKELLTQPSNTQIKEKIKLTKDYIKMYKEFARSKTDAEKIRWYVKYFMM